MSDTVIEHDTGTVTFAREPGDEEKLAHYADKNDIMRAAVEGAAIRALCGKMWVPTKDPGRFPVCPECKEIWESLPAD